ncbi:hypothetical protein MNEG_2434, partial [Monoraphidium neglectum]
ALGCMVSGEYRPSLLLLRPARVAPLWGAQALAGFAEPVPRPRHMQLSIRSSGKPELLAGAGGGVASDGQTPGALGSQSIASTVPTSGSSGAFLGAVAMVPATGRLTDGLASDGGGGWVAGPQAAPRMSALGGLAGSLGVACGVAAA